MKLRYIYDQHEIIGRFVAQFIPQVGYRGFGNSRAIGVIDEDGKLIAGLVYNNWNPISGTIEINGAAIPGSNWLTRETIRRGLIYPFEGCACQMVTMRVHAENERLLRQLAVGGFAFVKIARMFGRHDDGVFCTLTAEEWATNPLYREHAAPRVVAEPDPLDIPDYLRREKEAA